MKSDWNQFIIENSSPQVFLQTTAWGKFQQSLSKKVWFEKFEGGQYLAILEGVWPFQYLYVPRGPVLSSLADWPRFLESIQLLMKRSKVAWVRVEPLINWPDYSPWRRVKNRQPTQTLVVDLRPNLDQLFKSLHSKARYDIRLAQRRQVEVKVSAQISQEQRQTFCELAQLTATNQGFRSHSSDLYQQQIKFFVQQKKSGSKDKQILEPYFVLAEAIWEGKVINSFLGMVFGGTVTYLHGSSVRGIPNQGSTYATFWGLIKYFKKTNPAVTQFDLWGIAPVGSGNDHPWAGFTKIKSRFPGRYQTYPQAIDYLRQPSKYKWYILAKKIRNKLI